MRASRKIIGLAFALAVAGCAAPTAASAGTGPLQWWYGGTPIPLGETVEVPSYSHNQVTFDLAPSRATVTCKLKLTDAVVDTSRESPGSDRMVQVTFGKCTQGGAAQVCPSVVEASATDLPWASHLESEYFAPGEARNVFEGVGIELRCGKRGAPETFTGTLQSIVRAETVRKKSCTVFAFAGESSLSGASETLSVTGAVRMASKCGEAHGQLEARPPIKNA